MDFDASPKRRQWETDPLPQARWIRRPPLQSCRMVCLDLPAMELDALLKLMTDRGASDLHLKPTRPPLLRISGKLMPIDVAPVAPDLLSEMLFGILSAPQRTRLEEKLSVDVGYGVKGLARFRGNIYM